MTSPDASIQFRKYSSVISPVAKPNIHRQAASTRSLESETVLHGTHAGDLAR